MEPIIYDKLLRLGHRGAESERVSADTCGALEPEPDEVGEISRPIVVRKHTSSLGSQTKVHARRDEAKQSASQSGRRPAQLERAAHLASRYWAQLSANMIASLRATDLIDPI